MRKKIEFICLIFLILAQPGRSQLAMPEFSDSSVRDGHHFFWYSGHWSTTKKHTFVVDGKGNSGLPGGSASGNDGGTVTITPDGKVHVQGGEADEWNKKITDGLNDLDKFKQEATGNSQEANELAYHMNAALKPLLDSTQAEWTGYKIDPKQDILTPEQQGMQNLTQKVKENCQQFRARYEQIIQYYQAHKKDNENTVQNPLAPPELDEDCVTCDTTKAKEYRKKVNDFLDKFFQPETDMMKDALGLLRNLMMIGKSTDFDGASGASVSQDMADALESLFKPNKKDPSQSGACSYIDTYDLINAIKFFPMHARLRAYKLYKDYKKDFKAAKAVIRANMMASRECAMMGFTTDDAELFKNSASMIHDAYFYYKNKLVKDHDWSQLSNIPFILDMARSYYMMSNQDLDGPPAWSEDDKAGSKSGIRQLFDIQNHFYMILEMDLKVGRSGGYTYSHVKSDPVKIAPDLNYKEGRCNAWVVILNQPNSLGFPVKDMYQTIHFNLLANEFHTQGESPEYKGTKKYLNHLQFLKMDFCDPGKDSLLLTSIQPDPPGGPGFFARGYRVMLAGLAAGDRFFMNEKEMKELAVSGKAQQQMNTNVSQMQDRLAQMQSLAAQMGGTHDSASLAKLNQIKDMNNQVRSMNNNSNLAPMFYIYFLLKPNNKDNIIANMKFDAKEINAGTRLEEIIMQGEYKVRIEYRPKDDPEQ